MAINLTMTMALICILYFVTQRVRSIVFKASRAARVIISDDTAPGTPGTRWHLDQSALLAVSCRAVIFRNNVRQLCTQSQFER
jgi:hypothetical protein